MRLVFWNIRAGGGRRIAGIFAQLQQWQPDIIALAEFRGTPASQQLATQLAQAGWGHQLMAISMEKKAVNGLFLAATFELERLEIPLAPTEPHRWLCAKVHTSTPFTIGVMHIPNAHTGRKYPYHQAVLSVLDGWALGRGFLVGDTNTGKQILDEESPVFSQREHGWMEALEARGWLDAFRYLHGETRAYTWYSPNGGNGFRLDQAFLNGEIMPALQTMQYTWGQDKENPTRRDALSDHAAIILDLKRDKVWLQKK